MLFAARVYHTQSYNLTAQSNNAGCASSDSACAVPGCLEVVPTDLYLEISGRDFFCVLKENFNG